jgi:Zn-dependent peptidase ImmA (M78 family)
VILNPQHGKQRNRATLMEEIAHVFLGHTPNRLAVVAGDPAAGGAGKTLARDYNHIDEEAAYAIGAAALVPYAGLRRLVSEGRSSNEIARHFHVSRPLVEYRIKVTHLWAEYKRVSAARVEHV